MVVKSKLHFAFPSKFVQIDAYKYKIVNRDKLKMIHDTYYTKSSTISHVEIFRMHCTYIEVVLFVSGNLFKINNKF